MQEATPEAEVHPTTRGPEYHFFGYYDISPWDASGRYLLALEPPFMDHPPSGEEPVTIGVIDCEAGYAFHPLAETYAWNWQQGTRLQWLPPSYDNEIIYNARQDGRFVSVILNVQTGDARTLDYPIYTLAPDGTQAITLNFSRVHHHRPGYGYPGVTDESIYHPAPVADGIYRLDLRTGKCNLIISVAQMAALGPVASMEGSTHWFNHLLFNSASDRFIFLHRWKDEEAMFRAHRLYTANPDGTEICCLAGDELVSHFDWCGPDKVLAWASVEGRGNHFFLFTDRADEFEVIAEGVIDFDGHCSYSPDREWVLTDSYPDANRERTLIAYKVATGQHFDLGKFFSPAELEGEIRCDLHPRWKRDGSQICFDSVHAGKRQMYVAEFAAWQAGIQR